MSAVSGSGSALARASACRVRFLTADFLLTGDGRHFGRLYGKRIAGVMVLSGRRSISSAARGGNLARLGTLFYLS
jgi:hypothetical protein